MALLRYGPIDEQIEFRFEVVIEEQHYKRNNPYCVIPVCTRTGQIQSSISSESLIGADDAYMRYCGRFLPFVSEKS